MSDSYATCDTASAEQPLTWYVVRTAHCREAEALALLREQKFTAYLPREVRWQRLARKKVAVRRPLFPGYVFIGMAPGAPEFARARSVFGVRSFVSVTGEGGEPVSVPSLAIGTLVALEALGTYDYTISAKRRPKFKPGDLVRIIGGAFFGASVKFVEKVSDTHARVELKGMGGGKMKVDVSILEKAA